MDCLQIYQELSNLETLLRVHSNSKEVSNLSWQKTYPNLKTTCHIKLKFLVNVTPKELTPRKVSHICRCAFNFRGVNQAESFMSGSYFSQLHRSAHKKTRK